MSQILNAYCDHPGCKERATAGQINDVGCCVEHVDWAIAHCVSPFTNAMKAWRAAMGKPYAN